MEKHEITDRVFGVLSKNLNADELEKELCLTFGLAIEDYNNAVMLAKSQEAFAELLATKIWEKNNPVVEPEPSLGDSFYPKMKQTLEENRKPFEYDESKSFSENFYPNSPSMHRG